MNLHNFVRGLSPYPTAFTNIKIGEEEKSLKIYKGYFQPSEHSHQAGEIEITKNSFKIYTKDGIYFPEELQLQGKKECL